MKATKNEQWKPVLNFESRYIVSSYGRVYSLVSKKLLKPMKTQKGYLTVDLFNNYKRKNTRIHRLVAMAFIENPHGFKEINHIDGNKENNNVANLEWTTRAANMRHAYKTGLRIARKGIPRNKMKG